MTDESDMAAASEKVFDDYICLILIEGNGPFGQQLAELTKAALSQLERVDPMINPLSGEHNPYLSRRDPTQGGLPGARPPTYAILFNTLLVDEQPAQPTEEDSRLLIVCTTILRPDPFVCMIQDISWLPANQMTVFATKIAKTLNEHPGDGVAEFLAKRDMVLRVLRNKS